MNTMMNKFLGKGKFKETHGTIYVDEVNPGFYLIKAFIGDDVYRVSDILEQEMVERHLTQLEAALQVRLDTLANENEAVDFEHKLRKRGYYNM